MHALLPAPIGPGAQENSVRSARPAAPTDPSRRMSVQVSLAHQHQPYGPGEGDAIAACKARGAGLLAAAGPGTAQGPCPGPALRSTASCRRSAGASQAAWAARSACRPCWQLSRCAGQDVARAPAALSAAWQPACRPTPRWLQRGPGAWCVQGGQPEGQAQACAWLAGCPGLDGAHSQALLPLQGTCWDLLCWACGRSAGACSCCSPSAKQGSVHGAAAAQLMSYPPAAGGRRQEQHVAAAQACSQACVQPAAHAWLLPVSSSCCTCPS